MVYQPKESRNESLVQKRVKDPKNGPGASSASIFSFIDQSQSKYSSETSKNLPTKNRLRNTQRKLNLLNLKLGNQFSFISFVL
jgi:hypothetical protein